MPMDASQKSRRRGRLSSSNKRPSEWHIKMVQTCASAKIKLAGRYGLAVTDGSRDIKRDIASYTRQLMCFQLSCFRFRIYLHTVWPAKGSVAVTGHRLLYCSACLRLRDGCFQSMRPVEGLTLTVQRSVVFQLICFHLKVTIHYNCSTICSFIL